MVETLTQVKGIGRWTAQMFLIFSLGRPDVFPTMTWASGRLSVIDTDWRIYRTKRQVTK